MLEKFKIKFQSYIGLIYGINHLLLLCEPLKKLENHVLTLNFFKHASKFY